MLRDQINEALKVAVKSQDKRRMATLRLINAAIKDRDIAARTGGKDSVSDDEIRELLQKMVRQREESAVVYAEAGRTELAEQEREEIEIIRDFLPRQLSEDEIKSAVTEVIQEYDASGLKDMGRCMGALKERFNGAMDFGKAGKLMKEQLI